MVEVFSVERALRESLPSGYVVKQSYDLYEIYRLRRFWFKKLVAKASIAGSKSNEPLIVVRMIGPGNDEAGHILCDNLKTKFSNVDSYLILS